MRDDGGDDDRLGRNLTAPRIGEGLLESFSRLCPECEGRGVLIDQALLD